jgi:hypothetical protein
LTIDELREYRRLEAKAQGAVDAIDSETAKQLDAAPPADRNSEKSRPEWIVASRMDLIDRALAERSFADFVRQAWPALEPKTPYLENWHHYGCELVTGVEQAVCGELLILAERDAEMQACDSLAHR